MSRSITANDLKGKTIAFAASGGLDSCTITRWLTEHDVRVMCMCADMAQPDEESFDALGQRMRACGAAEFVRLPLRSEIAEAGIAAIQAQACYEGRYWNTTGLGRYVIVGGMVAEMRKRGIEILSHGATGRGNDQVRFQIATHMMAPGFEVYAPWRDPEFLSAFGGRQQMIDYCNARKLPIRATKDAPYSTDANLLGLTHEGGRLESLETPAVFVEPQMGKRPTDAADKPARVAIRFQAGRPVAIDGRQFDAFEAVSLANRIGGEHGIGIGVHLVENRFVGVKSRGVYEAPGMELLGTCYAYLLQLVLDRRARVLFDQLSQYVAGQIYQGYWLDLGSRMATAAIERTAALATGTITVELSRGNVSFVSASEVEHSLYSEADASMEAVGSFDHADSEGFLRVLSVSARALAAGGQTARER